MLNNGLVVVKDGELMPGDGRLVVKCAASNWLVIASGG